MNPNYYTTPLIHQKDRPPLEELPVEVPQRDRVFKMGRVCVKLFARHWRSKKSKHLTPAARGVEMRQFLEKMGGIWIKVGQVLAMRTDIFPVEFCSELSRLQDRSTTFPSSRSIEIIEANLGCPIDEVFDVFEVAPFAAASLSQVHRARLRESGEEVVIKVQRPYALEYFQYDLKWMTRFVKVLKIIPAFKHLRLELMLDEIREMMEEELDYRREASNMRRLKELLKQHNIIVPQVFLNYSTDRILVMEFLNGVFMSDYISVARTDPKRAREWASDNDIEPRIIAQRLFQSVMRQLYEDLFFHADLHPGNIVLLRENRLAFIDFGNCGNVDRKLAVQYEQYFLAMAEHALDKAADVLLLTMGKLPPIDIDAFKKRIVRVLDKQISRSYITNLPYREKSIGSNSAELNQIMTEFKIEVNWEMLKMARAFESVDQNISVLNPHFNFTREMQRYQERASRRKKQLRLHQLPNLLDQIANLSQIVLPAFMQRSLNIGGSVGKGIQIAAAFFGLIKKALILALIGVAWVYLYQHHNEVVDRLHEGEDVLTEVGVTSVIEEIPQMHDAVWFTKAAILVVIIVALGRFIKKLLQPDVRDQIPR